MARQRLGVQVRIAAILAALTLVLAACGDGDEGDGEATGGGESYKITLITGDNHDPFMVTMVEGCKDAAAEFGVEFD